MYSIGNRISGSVECSLLGMGSLYSLHLLFQSPQKCLHTVMSLGIILTAFKRAGPGNEYVVTNIFSYRS